MLDLTRNEPSSITDVFLQSTSDEDVIEIISNSLSQENNFKIVRMTPDMASKILSMFNYEDQTIQSRSQLRAMDEKTNYIKNFKNKKEIPFRGDLLVISESTKAVRKGLGLLNAIAKAPDDTEYPVALLYSDVDVTYRSQALLDDYLERSTKDNLLASGISPDGVTRLGQRIFKWRHGYYKDSNPIFKNTDQRNKFYSKYYQHLTDASNKASEIISLSNESSAYRYRHQDISFAIAILHGHVTATEEDIESFAILLAHGDIVDGKDHPENARHTVVRAHEKLKTEGLVSRERETAIIKAWNAFINNQKVAFHIMMNNKSSATKISHWKPNFYILPDDTDDTNHDMIEQNFINTPPVVGWMDVNSDLALVLLERFNQNNRDLREDNVEEIARSIDADDFTPMSPVIISWSKKHQKYEVSDGQHRLSAIAMADKSIRMPFIFGGDRDFIFGAMDTGAADNTKFTEQFLGVDTERHRLTQELMGFSKMLRKLVEGNSTVCTSSGHAIDIAEALPDDLRSKLSAVSLRDKSYLPAFRGELMPFSKIETRCIIASMFAIEDGSVFDEEHRDQLVGRMVSLNNRPNVEFLQENQKRVLNLLHSSHLEKRMQIKFAKTGTASQYESLTKLLLILLPIVTGTTTTRITKLLGSNDSKVTSTKDYKRYSADIMEAIKSEILQDNWKKKLSDIYRLPSIIKNKAILFSDGDDQF